MMKGVLYFRAMANITVNRPGTLEILAYRIKWSFLGGLYAPKRRMNDITGYIESQENRETGSNSHFGFGTDVIRL
jgi:hypothetical protein